MNIRIIDTAEVGLSADLQTSAVTVEIKSYKLEEAAQAYYQEEQNQSDLEKEIEAPSEIASFLLTLNQAQTLVDDLIRAVALLRNRNRF